MAAEFSVAAKASMVQPCCAHNTPMGDSSPVFTYSALAVYLTSPVQEPLPFGGTGRAGVGRERAEEG